MYRTRCRNHPERTLIVKPKAIHKVNTACMCTYANREERTLQQNLDEAHRLTCLSFAGLDNEIETRLGKIDGAELDANEWLCSASALACPAFCGALRWNALSL